MHADQTSIIFGVLGTLLAFLAILLAYLQLQVYRGRTSDEEADPVTRQEVARGELPPISIETTEGLDTE